MTRDAQGSWIFITSKHLFLLSYHIFPTYIQKPPSLSLLYCISLGFSGRESTTAHNHDRRIRPVISSHRPCDNGFLIPHG
ncbi:hypothetical protein BJX99DRAFT_195728 [Aspergillus californicus]